MMHPDGSATLFSDFTGWTLARMYKYMSLLRRKNKSNEQKKTTNKANKTVQ